MMDFGFFALMFRMKYINRWSLMRSNIAENLSEHSLETALIAGALANIGNQYFNKNYDSDKITVKALFHDAAEILTGDLPTPVKYYNDDIREAYGTVENYAERKIISLLPEELKQCYSGVFEMSAEEKKLVKSADKLCAYIKCVQEVQSGNKEFSYALESTESAINDYDCEELKYFIEHFLNAFFQPLDNLSL